MADGAWERPAVIHEPTVPSTVRPGACSQVTRERGAGVDDDWVALKRILDPTDEAAVRRLRLQTDVTRALDHPGIVRVRDVTVDAEGPLVVMDWVDGDTLASRVARGGPLSTTGVRVLVAKLAAALGYAHGRGVLHLDVSPGNVLLGVDGPVLIDFGGHQESPVWGTPGFIDPAVATGADSSVQSDVYGLGAVAYFALTGRPPALGEQLASSAAWPTSEETATMIAAIDTAIEPRPTDRRITMSELAAAMEPARKGVSFEMAPTRNFGPRTLTSVIVERPAGAAGAARRRAVSIVVGAVAVAAVTVAAFGVVAVGRTGSSRSRQRPVVSSRCVPPDRTVAGGGDRRFVVTGDIDGVGCPIALRWASGVLQVPASDRHPVAAAYRLGEPGDQLVLGDWSCLGRDTPALYRPSTGTVWTFDGWAGTGRSSGSGHSSSAGGTGGTAVVVHRPGDCDVVAVVDSVGAGSGGEKP